MDLTFFLMFVILPIDIHVVLNRQNFGLRILVLVRDDNMTLTTYRKNPIP
jgi:hypothetical protein